MKVKIRFFGGLREVTGAKEEIIESKAGETVGDVLSELSKGCGEPFDRYVYGKNGQIADNLQVLFNGTSITNLKDLKTKRIEGSQIDIIPLVSGG